METVTLKAIHKELKFVKKELRTIKEHMVDVDSIMTEDDYKAFYEYKREKSKGKLVSHEELKKDLGL